MKEHFNAKSLAFYGTMIGSVAILFQLITLYGEANLIAPPDLNGRYISTEAPPGCPKSSRLALDVQQSGVFLHGSLRLEESTTSTTQPNAEERPSLSGRWQQSQSQMTLAGRVPSGLACQPNQNAAASMPIALQGKIVQPEGILTGQLRLNEAQPWQFTAERQAVPKKSVEH